jgi:hypothetical protein
VEAAGLGQAIRTGNVGRWLEGVGVGREVAGVVEGWGVGEVKRWATRRP